MIDKLIVAPQIVVYKNLLKDSAELLEIINNNDRSDSLWPKWETWYEQGENINQLFRRKEFIINDSDSESLKKEKIIFQKICDIYDFVQKDYLNEFAKEKGMWPTYIKQWDKVWEKLDPFHINIYKYSNELCGTDSEEGLMLQYHVDEMPEVHDAPRHQVVTITFYLNDNYDGGEICFYSEAENKAYRYKPKSGDVTVFPSGAPFYHAVENFSGSDRYFMRIFIPYSADGDKEWLEENVFYNHDFMKQEEKKINEFVSKYSHAVTLATPGQQVDKVYGKLIQLDEEVAVIE